MVPETLRAELQRHLQGVRSQQEADLKAGYAGVWLPGALARKYPNAPREWAWQWVFPMGSLTLVTPEGGGPVELRRHHLPAEYLQRRIKEHQAGKSFATSYRGPWRLIYYEAYLEEADATSRERYLKSGSGRRFLRSQLRHHLLKHPLRPTA